ncbi:hypothetical protein HDA40_004714 [Hamadaea flava]|uniref:Transcriptional regulator, AbiEi antitoxin, Type IV TA system n=1 Tax=Hamadaea flava TaxID=1742688 RepID=A0ABV8LG40_9ACTN|nr:hypothetical protein [Hamadaea flava]MCP2326207.1 hypothetical protein [Hamadaea flava]
MPRRWPRPDLDGLLEKQYGLVRRDQVLGGMPDSLTKGALRWRLERGVWQTVLPAVYATHGGPLSREQRAFASLLYAGESAQLTGPTALQLHVVHSAPADDLVHVLIPDRRRLSPARFAAVSRTHRLDPRATTIGRMAVVSPARAVADTVRMVPGLDQNAARTLVVESLQRRLTTLDALQDELRDGPKRGSLLLRAALTEVEQGLRGSPLTRLRELCASNPALPEIRWQPALLGPDGEALPTPDGWIADTAIALEVIAPDQDPSPEAWTRRLRRQQAFTEYGVLVLTFTANELRIDPAAVLATIVRAYLDRARAGVRHAVRVAP